MKSISADALHKVLLLGNEELSWQFSFSSNQAKVYSRLLKCSNNLSTINILDIRRINHISVIKFYLVFEWLSYYYNSTNIRTNLQLDASVDSKELISSGFKIELQVQPQASDNEIINMVFSYDCTVINPFVDYSSLPAIFSDADMLLIANDFDSKGIAFLRYSMPTKASEYMISGTPVLVYSHFETAVSQFFMKNNCGCCVTEQSKNHLASSISKLICDTDYRKTLGTNAIRIATDLFDGERIRTEFRTLINELVITETPKS